MRRAALAGRTTPPPPERRARAESAVSKGPHRAPRTHSLWATKEEVRMSCQVDKDSSTTQEPRSGPVSAWLGEGSPVAILSPSPSTVLLPAARTSLPRRPGLAEPPLRCPGGGAGAPRASPPPAQPGRADSPPARTAGPCPGTRRARAARRSDGPGRSRRGAGEPQRRLAEQRAAAHTPPGAESKQPAGALGAAPPPLRGPASRPPAPPPPTWSVSLSTAILQLARARTHAGPRCADVTPGAGRAEGLARGRERNLAPEFDSPPPAPPPPPPPPAERLTLACGVCSRARPPLHRKCRLLPAGPPLTSPRAARSRPRRLGRRCLLPPAAAPRSPRPRGSPAPALGAPPWGQTAACFPPRRALAPTLRGAPSPGVPHPPTHSRTQTGEPARADTPRGARRAAVHQPPT